MVSAVPVQQAAPWESASPEEQLFVLITGANSGIGLGMCQRLIDEFLATRSLTSHLILMPTARANSKCAETTKTLQKYAANAAQTSDALKARAGGEEDYDWKAAAARIHILSLPLELCQLRDIYSFADILCNGTVSSPEGVEDGKLTNVRVPRIDSIVFNAGYGGWSGFSIPWAIYSIFTLGLTESTTYPNYKIPLPTEILNEKPRYNYPMKPLLAEVFCAGVFGHYVLGHELLPLLSRRKDDVVPPGRLIWTSSVEAHAKSFSISDIQSFTRPVAYESVKRLTDLVSLSSNLPAAQESVRSYLTISTGDSSSESSSASSQDDVIPPNMYLTHPGVVATSLFPVPWFLVWAYSLAIQITRWIGSPFHLPNSYMAAKAPAWVVMEPQEHLDDTKAKRMKLGSACDVSLNEYVKATEVEGWGWVGEVEDPAKDTTPGPLNRNLGRRKGMHVVTQDEIVDFERDGAYCWAELEKLRLQWEEILADE